ncbi:MAG: flagellar hook-basal body protein [Campylobacterota bacterium]|nr:flagellar hook-basal body protein [Campylobacterota bacterium]
MQSGFYSATGGMVTQFNRLDSIANNLANVNTAGFKKEHAIVGDFLRLYKNARDEMPLENNTKEGAQFYNRSMDRVPQVTDRYTDFSLGNMAKTGNTLDFALSQDSLFFAVNTPNGIRLTKDGSFTLNDQGVLVTKQGYEVLASDYFETQNTINFNTEDAIIESDKNGHLYNSIPGSSQLIQNNMLMVVSPENIQKLVKEGDNLFIPESLDSLHVKEESGSVLQGFVEKSNVNPINEMIAMIEANRLVGMYQKAMDSQMSDLNRDAIEKIARIN